MRIAGPDCRRVRRPGGVDAKADVSLHDSDGGEETDEVWGAPKQDILEYWENRRQMELKGEARHSASIRRRLEQAECQDRRVMWSAIVWAVIFTGGGHFRLGRPLRGSAFLVAFVAVAMIAMYVVSMTVLFPTTCSSGLSASYPSVSSFLSCSVLRTLITAIILTGIILNSAKGAALWGSG